MCTTTPSTKAVKNVLRGIILCAIFSLSLATEARNREDWLKLINQQHQLTAQGEYEKAINAGINALRLAKKIFTEKSLDTAISMNNLAQSYTSIGNHNSALKLQKEALNLFKAILPADHPDIATNLNNLSLSHMYLGNYQDAVLIQLQALSIREKSLGPDHQDTATSLNNLASGYLFLADYNKALELQLRALAIRSTRIKENAIGTANILNNIARTYFALGEFEKALNHEQQALEIIVNELGRSHPRTATSLSNIASTLRQLRKYDESLEYEIKALEIRELKLGPEHTDTAGSIESIAQLLALNHEHTQAIDFQRTVVEIKTKALGSDSPSTLISLNNLANMYFEVGKIKESQSLLQSIITGIEVSLGPTHSTTATVLSNIAHTYAATGEKELAIIFYKRSVNILQSQREVISKIGESELKSFTGSKAFVYKNLANLLTELGRLAEAMQVLEMTKESEQFEFIRRSSDADPRSSRINFTPNEQIWVSRYRQIADRLAALGVEYRALEERSRYGLSNAQKQRKRNLEKDLNIAKKAFNSFLIDLRESFAKKGPARAVEVLETSQQALRDKQALLKELGSDTVLLQYYLIDDKVGMLLTTAGVQLARTTPINSIELSRQIVEFLRMLRDPKTQILPAAKALYELLVGPVEKDLEQVGAKNIMLSLDGALRYLPFSALHDGKQYLVQRWNLPLYTSVTKGKLRDTVTAHWYAVGLGLTRAIGDFPALPAVKAEMSTIVRTGASGVLPGEVYLDEAFNAVRFKEVSQRKFHLLHVASHFQFSPGTEINSFLLLGDGNRLTLGDIRTKNFRFDNVDLLTLSACDTGLGGGRDVHGREIEGFGVIAQQQGAKAVLATLWPVADQSTATLMADMYKKRQEKNLTKIESLRQAQISLLSQPRYAHPFYWAPFILMGNWK
jgi:CHAT domain-containing protein